jgi:hypothetical protein
MQGKSYYMDRSLVPAILLTVSCLQPASDADQHKPHAFTFSYEDEVTVLEGQVWGEWFGNSHSAVFIELIDLPEPQGEEGQDIDARMDVIIDDEPGSLLPPDIIEVDIDDTIVEYDPSFGAFPVEESAPDLWELETFPVFTLEQAGWEAGTLAEGDLVIATVRYSTDRELHAQLIEITRLSDGWIGLGFPLPAGVIVETPTQTGDQEPVGLRMNLLEKPR